MGAQISLGLKLDNRKRTASMRLSLPSSFRERHLSVAIIMKALAQLLRSHPGENEICGGWMSERVETIEGCLNDIMRHSGIDYDDYHVSLLEGRRGGGSGRH